MILKKDIKLIQQYFEGETSNQEDQEIAYRKKTEPIFAQKMEEYRKYKLLIQEAEITLFEEEDFFEEIKPEQKEEKTHEKIKITTIFNFTNIAVSVLILCILGAFLWYFLKNENLKDKEKNFVHKKDSLKKENKNDYLDKIIVKKEEKVKETKEIIRLNILQLFELKKCFDTQAIFLQNLNQSSNPQKLQQWKDNAKEKIKNSAVQLNEILQDIDNLKPNQKITILLNQYTQQQNIFNAFIQKNDSKNAISELQKIIKTLFDCQTIFFKLYDNEGNERGTNTPNSEENNVLNIVDMQKTCGELQIQNQVLEKLKQELIKYIENKLK